ncbi:hypothetical protein ACWDBO_37295 [Streptomyces mirabilis]|uniref:hypothetical protein n=1 Tax=Streptomyces mirabilis TaxID=68239 RepID=UPI0033232EBB
MTAELLEELETTIKRFRVTPDQAAELNAEAEEITVTWQRITSRPPSLLVTAPAGEDCWAMPIPHRPDWLMKLILKNAPAWWLK